MFSIGDAVCPVVGTGLGKLSPENLREVWQGKNFGGMEVFPIDGLQSEPQCTVNQRLAV